MPIRGYSVASPTRTLQIVGGLAQREPQDLSSSGVPTSGRSGRGHEEVVGRVYGAGLDGTL